MDHKYVKCNFPNFKIILYKLSNVFVQFVNAMRRLADHLGKPGINKSATGGIGQIQIQQIQTIPKPQCQYFEESFSGSLYYLQLNMLLIIMLSHENCHFVQRHQINRKEYL